MGKSEKHYSPIEGVLAVLDEGIARATNKYALLLGLIDLCPQMGEADHLEISSIAEYLIELQWSHIDSFHDFTPKQIAKGNREAPVVLSEILRLRSENLNLTFHETRKLAKPQDWNLSIKRISDSLRKNPLSKLQTISGTKFEFLFSEDFSGNTVKLFPESKRALILYGGALRPLVESKFVRFVLNNNFQKDEYSQLEEFLFGKERAMPSKKLRGEIYNLQNGKCIYTGLPLEQNDLQVDHVLPWSRIRLSHLQNLVLTSGKLNQEKTNLLPSLEFVESWALHRKENLNSIKEIAQRFNWPSDLSRVTLSLKSLYANAPVGTPLFGRLGIEPFEEESRSQFIAALDAVTN